MISSEVLFNTLNFYQITHGTYDDYGTVFTVATVEPLTTERLNKIVATYLVTLHPELIVLRDEVKSSWLFCQYPEELENTPDRMHPMVQQYTTMYMNQLFEYSKVKAYLNSLDGIAVINSTELYDGKF